jgi:hypothetical protein
MKTDEPVVPTAVHGPLGITYNPNEKANAIADCLENQFTPHDVCDENHERRMGTRIKALPVSVDDTPLGKTEHLPNLSLGRCRYASLLHSVIK